MYVCTYEDVGQHLLQQMIECKPYTRRDDECCKILHDELRLKGGVF